MSRFSVKHAEFVFEARTERQLPRTSVSEVAFAGRSNVGKSTLLNFLCQRDGLARTSKTPGCTRGLVCFNVTLQSGATFRFMDLPGYGFAQRAKTERAEWQSLIEGYFESGRCRLVLILVDARRGIEPEELALMDYLRHVRVPFVIVATKIDRVPARERANLASRLAQQAGAPVALTSGETGAGRDDLWRIIVAS